MANTKLDRIERDIEKTRAKILEQQKKLKEMCIRDRRTALRFGSVLENGAVFRQVSPKT